MIDGRTFECVLCRGTPIARTFGVERLRILASSIDLTRTRGDCAISMIDSLMEDSVLSRSLGKLIDARIENGALHGTIRCHRTPQGEKAAELVAANKVSMIIGYSTIEMEIFDSQNRRVSPDDSERANERGLVFEIVKWQPAVLGLARRDPAADEDFQDRSYTPISPAVAEIFERMVARHMASGDDGKRVSGRRARPEINRTIFDAADRGASDEGRIVAATRARLRAAQKLIECGGNVDWKAIRLPPDLIYYGNAEKFKP